MKKLLVFILLTITCSTFAEDLVTNVQAYQSGKEIIITYDLKKDAQISISVSYKDNGRRKTNVLYNKYRKNDITVIGDIGFVKEGKNKKIVWNVLESEGSFQHDDVQFTIDSEATESNGIENKDRVSAYKYITESFFYNWDIAIGGGIQFYSFTGTYSHKLNNYGAFKDRLSPELAFSIGKWITPIWGFRGTIQGAWLYGMTQQVDYSTEGAYCPWWNVNQKGMNYFTSDRMPGMTNPKTGYVNSTTMGTGAEQRPILRHQMYYLAPQFQLMCNLSAWCSGYRPTRVYNAVIFGGVGAICSLSKEENYYTKNDWSVSFGLSNCIHIHKVLDLCVDFQSLLFRDRFYNPAVTNADAISRRTGSRYISMVPSLQLGINFHLPKQEFKRFKD